MFGGRGKEDEKDRLCGIILFLLLLVVVVVVTYLFWAELMAASVLQSVRHY